MKSFISLEPLRLFVLSFVCFGLLASACQKASGSEKQNQASEIIKQGDAKDDAGDKNAALDFYIKARDLWPENPNVYTRIAGVCIGLDKRDMGLEALGKLEALRPEARTNAQVMALKSQLEALNVGSATSPGLATKDHPFVNSLGMKFVPVVGTKALFSIWDTRISDYSAYAGAVKGVNDAWRWSLQTDEKKTGAPPATPYHPVANVSWNAAKAFCQWLTAKEQGDGLIPHGWIYRLPTDEEWSLAAGLQSENGDSPMEKSKNGEGKTLYPWGSQWPPPTGAGNFADKAYGEARKIAQKDFPAGLTIPDYVDGFAYTSPVGSFKPNKFGLFDMAGNVFQWCGDFTSSKQDFRVIRGSGYNTGGYGFRKGSDEVSLSFRDGYVENNCARSNIGFRPVLADSGNSSIFDKELPAGKATSELKGTDRLKYDALQLIANDCDAAKDQDEQTRLMFELLDKSGEFLAKRQDLPAVWGLRAEAAMYLGEKLVAREAGQQLLQLKADESPEPKLRGTLTKLERQDLLSKKDMFEAESVSNPDLLASAKAGNAHSQVDLGYNIRSDFPEKAAFWNRKSAELGEPVAMYNLGFCYLNGTGLEKNEREAVKWYRKGAEQIGRAHV